MYTCAQQPGQLFVPVALSCQYDYYMQHPDTRKLNVIIVDDEPDACKNLQHILLDYVDPGLHIAGVAHNTAAAELLINTHRPDVVFLDIEMPEENAFSFLERIQPVHFEIVFITAYDAYAVKAFRLNAVDYILKPLDIEEMMRVVEKLKQKLLFKEYVTGNAVSYGELAALAGNKVPNRRLILKGNNAVEVVDFNDIVFIEARKSYAQVYFIKDNIQRRFMMSYSIAEYEEMLPQEMFYRVHKSYLVNCSHIKKLHKDEQSFIITRCGASIPVSRRRYTSLLNFLRKMAFEHA